MFVNVSPASVDGMETVSSLKFAARVRNVEVGPATKHADNADLLRTKKAVRLCLACLCVAPCTHTPQLKAKEDACAKLEQELEVLRARTTVQERQLSETRDRSSQSGAELQKAASRIRKLEEMLMEKDAQLRAAAADAVSARVSQQYVEDESVEAKTKTRLTRLFAATRRASSWHAPTTRLLAWKLRCASENVSWPLIVPRPPRSSCHRLRLHPRLP
jgi:septal ring factor EnvC (AmiA/AmiB activator)